MMTEDKLTPQERVRLEAIAQARLAATGPEDLETERLLEKSRKIADFITGRDQSGRV